MTSKLSCQWEPVSSAIHSTSPRYLHSLGVTNLVKFISCTLLKMIELCPAEQEIFNETRAVVIEVFCCSLGVLVLFVCPSAV